MRTCLSCNKGKTIEVEDIVMDMDGCNFIVKGTRCTVCGEEFIDEHEGQKMINIAKKMGVWGKPLKLNRRLSKSARGTILRIPIDVEKDMNLKGNEEVYISKVGERKLVVEIK